MGSITFYSGAMLSKEGARSVLRSATAPHHGRVDRLFSSAALADREVYGRFLMAHAEAHGSIEEALTRAGAASVLPDWPERRRVALLHADLAALGLAMPPATETLTFAGPAAVLGGVYVLEGSRLGGRLLKRSVPPQFPSSFLGAGEPSAWHRLLAILEEQLDGEAKLHVAIAAAADVFALFERSGRRFLRAERP